MKQSLLQCIVALAFFLAGCATVTRTIGRDFDASKVSQIEKGKSTDKELVAWFGQPVSKSVSGPDGEIWTYTFTMLTTAAKSYGISVSVKQEGTTKKLEVLLKNGVVQNSTYTEGPIVERIQ